MTDADATDDAAAARKKLYGRLVWGFLIVSVAATIVWRLVAGDGGGDPGEVKWRCVPEPPRDVTCVFESDVATRGLCFDLLLRCGETEHRAPVCSGAIGAGGRAEVRVGEMSPPLAAAPVCNKPRYDNRRTP